MAYQVLARKWRPQRFDDVVGQQAVTRTLRNALTSGRIAQAFVFAGPRGCGKTTTARILARALSCEQGPTPDPCGTCDACIEIAQGRDIDVLEIDAASHTQVENIREVVIAGLSIAPVRNRRKIFIIDEVHQLSNHSFNALLKSIEEPPPHVVFMMATTELGKIPDTILSRSQVFEFRTIPAKAITQQLRTICDAEQIQVEDAALALIARAAEGSMRDAQSALDQVISFAGASVTVDDVSTVLGLVGRDLLFDLLAAVIAEDGLAAFALADRAVEAGHDLRLVCRELSNVVRDMMVLSIDPARASVELVEGEREPLAALGAQCSREDLLRAFDLLAKAEQEIRYVAHPRYYFEMALLRWIHLRRLTPLADLMDQMGPPSRAVARSGEASPSPRAVTAAPGAARSTVAGKPSTADKPAPAARAATAEKPGQPDVAPSPPVAVAAGGGFKDRFLAEIRGGKGFFYNTVVAQAQRIDVTGDKVLFTFLPAHKMLREQVDQARGWLEAAAERVAGKTMTVVAVQAGPGEPPVSNDPAPIPPPGPASPERAIARGSGPASPERATAREGGTRDLKAEAMESPSVQAMLDVFPAQIRDVEEM